MLEEGSGNKTWIERGVGNICILRHRKTQRLRVLMRREIVLNVICNHALDPQITLEPSVGSEKSWVWTALDFADGQLKETTFAVKFADSEIALDFKNRFEELQAELLAGGH
jgi:hypothetical protein